jgi:hypothetical protein
VLRVSERIVDQDAQSILDGYGVLTITWPDEAPRNQRLDFIRPDLHPNDSLPAPVSFSIAAHALGCRCEGFVKINQLLDTAELRAGPLRRSSVEVAH